MQNNTVKKRIGWIDAMRGFTMILVVFSHIEVFGLGMEPDGGINGLLKLVRMPLFFFISGFIAYRKNEYWDYSYYKTNLLKKLRVQLIPMLFFGLIFATVFYSAQNGMTPKEGVLLFIDDSSKLGYWFTEALLIMFLIYYTVSLLTRKCKAIIKYIILIAIALFFYLMAFRSQTGYNHINYVRWFSINNVLLYFQFFVCGNIVSYYREKVFKALDNQYAIGVIVLLFIIFLILYKQRADVQGLYVHTTTSKLLAETIHYLGIATILAVFRRYENFFSSKTKVGKGLQYIGTRTLDVYLLHYFFIPTIPFLGAFFTSQPSVLLEATTVVALSLLVIVFCLIVSNTIRVSPFLAHWLLGVKQKK